MWIFPYLLLEYHMRLNVKQKFLVVVDLAFILSKTLIDDDMSIIGHTSLLIGKRGTTTFVACLLFTAIFSDVGIMTLYFSMITAVSLSVFTYSVNF